FRPSAAAPAAVPARQPDGPPPLRRVPGQRAPWRLALNPTEKLMMRTTPLRLGVALLSLAFGLLPAAQAASFFFATGNPDGLIGTASRPASNGNIEIESADDFILQQRTVLNSATFTGLLPSGSSLADVQQVRVEIYRVF